MGGIWTNRNSHGDFFRNGILNNSEEVTELYFAVAFFTDAELVKEYAERSHRIRMVVRLGFPTSPTALASLMTYPIVELRYYSDRSFHPKLYIFGDRVALVGSANLTNSALMTNQEVAVAVGSDDPRFDDLTGLFSEYWDQAEVLTEEVLSLYADAHEKVSAANRTASKIENEFEVKVGKSVFQNIDRGTVKKKKDLIFLDSYRKTYQEAVSAFEVIASVYKGKKRRKTDVDQIPIRLEIDSFFSFVRDTHAVKDNWKSTSIGWSDQKEQLVSQHIDEWFERDWFHFDETICNENYPSIIKTFGSESSLQSASYDEILDSLTVLHSFHDRLRFFPGGLATLMETFKQQNELDHVKQTLNHLIFGEGDVVRRMADLIYDERFKLKQFGPSNVQELIGWVGGEDLPVLNGRTTKVLRHYGFGVRQL